MHSGHNSVAQAVEDGHLSSHLSETREATVREETPDATHSPVKKYHLQRNTCVRAHSHTVVSCEVVVCLHLPGCLPVTHASAAEQHRIPCVNLRDTRGASGELQR